VATEGGGVVRWDLQTFKFRQYLAPQDGLASNEVGDLEILDGVLWAATEGGLARFDRAGDRFENFTPENSPGMPTQVVTALEATADGALWVGFSQVWDPNKVNRFTNQPGAFAAGGLARFEPASGAWGTPINVVYDGERSKEKYKTIPSENVTGLELASDGILWIGTKPFYDWDDAACFDNQECKGYWLLRGGGLAAYDGSAWTQTVAAEGAGGCFSNTITDMKPGSDGYMWVATSGRGVLLMKGMRKTACNSGQPYYVKNRAQPGFEAKGLEGNLVWSVGVDLDGKVWMGHGNDPKTGRGVAILDHNNTFEDSSASADNGVRGDDRWQILQLDGREGDHDALVTAMDLNGPIKLLGTKNERHGSGFGLRAYFPAEERWQALRTADDGIPSNAIRDIAVVPGSDEVWVSTAAHGLAHFDGEHWKGMRMFGQGDRVATITLDLRQGLGQLPVDLATLEEFEAAFPLPAYLRLENDPTYYRVSRYIAARAGLDPQIKVSPSLTQAIPRGTGVYTVFRGPPSDEGTQIAVDARGHAFAGGGETIWLGDTCSGARAAIAQCWLDGGFGEWDGSQWKISDLDNSPLKDQFIKAVAVAPDGKVWASMSDGVSSGYGLVVRDPATDGWTLIDRAGIGSGQKFGGNGINDISIDPVSGDVWTAHHTVVEWTQNLGGTWNRIFLGGGVSRWEKATGKWSHWGKRVAPLQGYSSQGTDGEMTALLADRTHGRIWVGSWAADDNFHWINGYGVHAAINWCPLENCANADWQSTIWREDGKVSAIAQDASGNVWVGTTRNGKGLIPPVGGVKVFNGSDWSALTPKNVDIVSNQVTALEADVAGRRMWVGSHASGISVYDEKALATPTPRTSATTPPTATSEATPTSDATGPVTSSPTPVRTATPTRRPTQSAEACGLGSASPCRIYLPFAFEYRTCPGLRRCPVMTAEPVPPLFTPSPAATRVPPTATTAPTGTSVPTAVDPPTSTATVTASPSASPTGPTPTASASPRVLSPTPSPSPTLPPSQTPVATATQAIGRLGEWSVFVPGGARPPTVAFRDVTATGPNDVWFVGDEGKVLHWDGSQLTEASANTQANLRSITMIRPGTGYVAGDGGTLLQLRGNRWTRANTGSYTDDWVAVSGIDAVGGPVAWVLGGGRGNRLRLGEVDWAPDGPADRNTGHSYSAVQVVGPSLAYATQGGTGSGRIYEWNGTEWGPSISTGPLLDLHVPSPDLGVAVGPRGVTWWLDEETGKWVRMPKQPSTAGQDLEAVAVTSRDRIFAGGGRASLYHWNGVDWAKVSIRGTVSNRGILGIWISPDGSQGWAVGEGGLILRYE
jgi:hypothetical protein